MTSSLSTERKMPLEQHRERKTNLGSFLNVLLKVRFSNSNEGTGGRQSPCDKGKAQPVEPSLITVTFYSLCFFSNCLPVWGPQKMASFIATFLKPKENITCSPMDLLQWMGAVRARVQTVDKNIIIHNSNPVFWSKMLCVCNKQM